MKETQEEKTAIVRRPRGRSRAGAFFAVLFGVAISAGSSYVTYKYACKRAQAIADGSRVTSVIEHSAIVRDSAEAKNFAALAVQKCDALEKQAREFYGKIEIVAERTSQDELEVKKVRKRRPRTETRSDATPSDGDPKVANP